MDGVDEIVVMGEDKIEKEVTKMGEKGRRED